MRVVRFDWWRCHVRRQREAALAPMACAVAIGILMTLGSSSSAASFPTLTTPSPCWIWNGSTVPGSFPVAGTGFEPNATVDLVLKGYENDNVAVQTDASGNLAGMLQFDSQTLIPRTAIVEAYSYSFAQPPPPPQLLATLPVQVIESGGEGGHEPDYVALHRRATWTFGGYPDAAVYAHYFFRRLTYPLPLHLQFVKTTPLGRTTGPCGVLRDRFDLFRQVRARVGEWNITFNTSSNSPRTIHFGVNPITLTVYRSTPRAPGPVRPGELFRSGL